MKQIIIQEVFENKKVKEISKSSDANGFVTQWVMNFKSVSTKREFLNTYTDIFNEKYKDKKVQIGGMESGAIPLITALALGSESVSGCFYVRKARKKHDLSNIYEGNIDANIPIVLVDDILNGGSTFLKQIIILEEEGFKVKEVFAIVKFRDDSFYKELEDKGIKINYIFELDDFKKEIGLVNLDNIKKEARVPFDKYQNIWGIKLNNFSENNMYSILPKSGLCDDEKYIYTGSDDGSFYCIEKETGDTKWKYKISFGVPGKNIFSTPTTSSKFVFFGAYDGNLYCLSKDTGKVVWIFYDADYIGSSPNVENNKYVYIALEFGWIKKKGGVAKIDIKTGKAIWTNYNMSALTHASPVSNTKLGVVVCGCNDSYVYCFDKKNGNIKWKYKTNGEVKYGCVFDEKKNLVIIASVDGGVYCIKIKDGTLYHRFEGIFGFYSTPALDKDTIYIGGLDKRVYCFDLKTKNKKWEVVTAGRIFASPALHKECVYIGSNDGNLYEIEKEKGKILSRTMISERIVNKIIIKEEITSNNISKKVMYIKSFTNDIYKFVEK